MKLYCEIGRGGLDIGLRSEDCDIILLYTRWYLGYYGLYLISKNSDGIHNEGFLLGLAIKRKIGGIWGLDIDLLFKNFFITLYKKKKEKIILPSKYIDVKGKQITGGN